MEVQERLRVALLQRNIISGSVEANYRGFEAMLAELPEGVDLVLLPEMFTTGFNPATLRQTEPHMGPTVQWMQAIAAERQILLCGTIPATEGDRLYNRFYFAWPDGKVDWYDKRHLFALAGEERHFTPGYEQKVFTYLGWRICPQVCYDIRFPEWSRNFGQYDLLLYPASFPAARDFSWTTLMTARAIENQAYTAGCNRTGLDDAGLSYRGSSQIIAPSGRIIGQLGANATGLVLGDCSMDYLQEHRARYPFLRDANRFTLEG